LVDIAVAYGRQNKEQEASEYLIDAKNSVFLDLHCLIYSIFQAKLKPLHVFLLDGNISLCDALQLKEDVEKAEKIATELLDIDNTYIEICYQKPHLASHNLED
jgi:hypothetical protein